MKIHYMEIAFLFDRFIDGIAKKSMARLINVLPERYILTIPKGKASSSLLADFLDRCPGFSVTKIDKNDARADLIFFSTKEIYWSETVEEVCNAINDVFDVDITIRRLISAPSILPENEGFFCNSLTM